MSSMRDMKDIAPDEEFAGFLRGLRFAIAWSLVFWGLVLLAVVSR